MQYFKKTCSFFGHRDFCDTDNRVYKLLVEKIESLILEGYNEFLFGGYGIFDSLAFSVVKMLKKSYSHIRMIYYQAYYIPQNKDKDLLYLYDGIAYPEIERKPKKLAIIYRNQEMINNSDFCIFFVERQFGGAYLAIQYAMKIHKSFINLFNYLFDK